MSFGGGILGFDNGIVLAPMGADIASPKLVAAVANAGGIGLLAGPVNNYDMAEKAITETKKLTSKPFGCGILLPFDNQRTVQAIFDEKLACMQVYWGDYSKEMVDEAHKHGVKILHQIGSMKDAEKAVAAGVDCIIAQGVEAGGHIIGTVSVIALVPRVVDLVGDRDIAVVAAGSITDPRGFIFALSLGAKGICMGTRFVASKESYAHDYYKQQLLHYTEADTDRTDLYSRASWRAPVRCLNTPFHNQWKNVPKTVENDEEQPIIGYSTIYGGETVLRRFAGQVANPTTSGELEHMVMYAGQGVGLVKEIIPAGEIISNFIEGAKDIIIKLGDTYLPKLDLMKPLQKEGHDIEQCWVKPNAQSSKSFPVNDNPTEEKSLNEKSDNNQVVNKVLGEEEAGLVDTIVSVQGTTGAVNVGLSPIVADGDRSIPDEEGVTDDEGGVNDDKASKAAPVNDDLLVVVAAGESKMDSENSNNDTNASAKGASGVVNVGLSPAVADGDRSIPDEGGVAVDEGDVNDNKVGKAAPVNDDLLVVVAAGESKMDNKNGDNDTNASAKEATGVVNVGLSPVVADGDRSIPDEGGVTVDEGGVNDDKVSAAAPVNDDLLVVVAAEESKMVNKNGDNDTTASTKGATGVVNVGLSPVVSDGDRSIHDEGGVTASAKLVDIKVTDSEASGVENSVATNKQTVASEGAVQGDMEKKKSFSGEGKKGKSSTSSNRNNWPFPHSPVKELTDTIEGVLEIPLKGLKNTVEGTLSPFKVRPHGGR